MLIAAVAALALVWWVIRKPAAASPRPLPVPGGSSGPVTERRTSAAAGSAVVTGLPAALAPAQPLPPALAHFEWQSETDLDPQRRDRLLAAVRGIPRPPRSMQQLLSPDFVAKASSADLSELVMGEPLIAAKVLATVNGSFYGLQQPVTNIGQAVTFLGINSVRSICLQYMLAEAFKPKLAEAQQAFDRIWKASAIASELAVRLGKALHLHDQGSLATQVVLGFVGPLATASLMPPTGLTAWLGNDRLARARQEQDLVGLSASEMGAVLMKTWELPEALVADVADSGRLLVTDPHGMDLARLPRLAMAYLCMRLGERLALGQLTSLQGYYPQDDATVDTHHLRTALSHPALASRLDAALQAPELQATVRQMLGQKATD